MGAKRENRGKIFLLLLLVCGLLAFCPMPGSAAEKVGVLFVIHGGMDNYHPQYLWDSSVQMFSYEPNHSVYQLVIWCPDMWPAVLTMKTGSGPKETKKYAFEYDRIGGTDPFQGITNQQMADMVSEMNRYSCENVEFVYDYARWMSGDDIAHYTYPRFIYYGPPAWDGVSCDVLDPNATPPSNCTYCGERDAGGPWPDCDPERYNVAGPIERLVAQQVSRLVLIDLTVGGVRFSKTFDVLKMTRRALHDLGQDAMPVTWINDINNLMTNSYPDSPSNWTPQWSYVNGTASPFHDVSVPFASNPNPVASDPELIALNVEGIEASMSPSVPDSQTGILILDHALVDWAEYFDPKINDTLTIIEGIKTKLLLDHPGIDPNNIVGAYMGIKENGSAEGYNGLERTRHMRGENLGQAWLYESAKQMPAMPWGYRYWDALEYLKNRGVKHIVIGFPQIISDSVLNLVEIPNQIGKELGIKTWAKWGTFDYTTYPGIGHPFADYWGMWVDNACGQGVITYNNGTVAFGVGKTLTGQTSHATGVITAKTGTVASGTLTVWRVSGTFQNGEVIKDNKATPGTAKVNGNPVMTVSPECCFVLGGCNDPKRPYPPPRQSTGERDELDPSLAYDLSDYGELGYNGTWEMYCPASANPRVGKMLAQQILQQFTCALIPPTAINLADLKAIAGSWKVTLTWTTASEIDNAGFNIYRSTEENGTYTKINAELIPAKGSPSGTATYQFTDKPVKNRITYWYKLEDVDVKGASTMHGPISATPKLMAIFSKK